MSFSACMFLRNEERMLRVDGVLSSYFGLDADEFLVVMDRTSDKSRDLIEGFAHFYGKFDRLRIIEVWCESDFKYRTSYLNWVIINEALCDWVLILAPDLYIDFDTINYAFNSLRDKVGVISFFYYDFNAYTNAMKILSYKFTRKAFFGLFMYDRRCLSERIESKLKDVISADSMIFNDIKEHWDVAIVDSCSWHLRKSNTSMKHGVDLRKRGLVRGFVGACVRSIVRGSPNVLKGFILGRGEESRRG